jgi:hypothetical protein
MAQNFIRQVGYGLNVALPNLSPNPIQANRAPVGADKGYLPGTLWIYKAANAPYILTSVVNNVANWQLLTVSGSAGVFSSLTVTPGPISLTGATVINNTGAANTAIGTGTNTGVLALGNTGNAGTSIEGANITMDSAAAGTIFVGTQLTAANVSILSTVNTGAQVVSILNGNAAGDATFNLMNGVPSAGNQIVNIVGANNTRAALINIGTGNAAHQITVGSTNAQAAVTIAAGIAGGIDLSGAGSVTMTAVTDTQASPSATAAIAANVGVATFTGFTTAAAATQVFTITNAVCTATSQIFVTASNEGANDAQMTVTRVNRGAGTFNVTLLNNGAAALNGNVSIAFWIIG